MKKCDLCSRNFMKLRSYVMDHDEWKVLCRECLLSFLLQTRLLWDDEVDCYINFVE